MKINIFGVGRSGTKAVQLYTAYAITEKEERVRINYEPYFLQTTKGPVSFEGIKHNASSDFITDTESSFSVGHRKFLKKIADHDDLSVVTKFIRGNGRINAINNIIKPDLSIIIVRNLYEVLNSVILMNWNLYSIGYGHFRLGYVSYLDRLIKEAEEKLPLNIDLHEINRSLPSRIAANAIYWYIMNLAAIVNKDVNTSIIDYHNIESVKELLFNKGFDTQYKMSDSMFRGSNLHENFPLATEKTKVKSKLYQGVNELLFYGAKVFNKQYIIADTIGETKKISIDASAHSHTKQSENIKAKLANNRFLDELNDDIFKRF